MLRFKVYRDARGLGGYNYFEGRLQRNPKNDADKGLPSPKHGKHLENTIQNTKVMPSDIAKDL